MIERVSELQKLLGTDPIMVLVKENSIVTGAAQLSVPLRVVTAGGNVVTPKNRTVS